MTPNRKESRKNYVVKDLNKNKRLVEGVVQGVLKMSKQLRCRKIAKKEALRGESILKKQLAKLTAI